MKRLIVYVLVTGTGLFFGWWLGEMLERWTEEGNRLVPDDADMLGDAGPLTLVKN